MENQMNLSGTYKYNDKGGQFTGTVTFDDRQHLIYYSWLLRDGDGNILGGKSMPIYNQHVPVGEDRLEFSRKHALEGIKKFRIGREYVIHELIIT